MVPQQTSCIQGIADLGAITRLQHLKRLVLCFNQLRHLVPLTSLQQLQHLDVSHNNLSTAAGLDTLTSITSLNLGHNKLAQITQVYSLPSLQQLCLHSNRISDAAVVQELSNLRQLRRLSLGNNPVNNQLTNWKAATREILPGLEVSMDCAGISSHFFAHTDQACACCIYANGVCLALPALACTARTPSLNWEECSSHVILQCCLQSIIYTHNQAF